MPVSRLAGFGDTYDMNPTRYTDLSMDPDSGDAMHWLLDVSHALSACRTEHQLCETSLNLIADRFAPRHLALALTRPAEGRLACVLRNGLEALEQGTDLAAPFEPGSTLRDLLYGDDLGPDGRGWRVQAAETSWPFPGVDGDFLWLSLRAGPEIVGCIVADVPARVRASEPEVAPLLAMASTLALYVQVLRLRSDQDARIDELDTSIRRLTIEQTWLRATSSSLAASRTVKEVVDLTYDAIRFALGFDRVAIFLMQHVRGRRVLVELAGTTSSGARMVGDPSGEPLDVPDLEVSSPDVAHILAGDAYYYCPDRWAITPPKYRAYLDGHMREQIVVAVRHGDQLLGTVSVDNTLTGRPLLESQAEVLVTFAQQVGTALENARLTEAEAQARARAEALLRASQAMYGSLDLTKVMQTVAHEARQALRAATCELVLYDEDATNTIAHFREGYTPEEVLPYWNQEDSKVSPLDVSSEREMIETMSPVLIDTADDPPLDAALSSILGTTARLLVPLLIEREGVRAVQGALYANYVGKYVTEITGDEIDLACAMAAHAATALEKARLYAVEKERARRLQEVDSLRREFLATVSHELRTPLTGVIGFAETLTHFWDQLADERRYASVQKILASAQRLDRLVRDLLLASRIEDVRFTVRQEVVDASTIVRQAADEIRAKYKEQEVSTHLPDLAPLVLADGERLCQIIVNLLDNAVKYSDEGLPVTVGVDVRSERVGFWVEDNGPGLTETEIDRLFERFAKLGHPARAGTGGTGLGLYICRHLARAMGGDIQVASKPGVGSIFTLDLALAG
jgi:signal transduction histidine kinase